MSSSKNADRLSKLPEEIRSHILSLMPTIFAVRTSILSKTWRYSWTLVTNLDFDEYDDRLYVSSFPELVHQVLLKLCKASLINSFRLWLSYDTAARMSSVSNWIDEAVRLNVHEVDIKSCAMYMHELLLSLFTCKTLTKLTITSTAQEFSFPVNLPCLKILDISDSEYPLDHAFEFISGSPMLESLSLEVSSVIDGKDYTFDIPTLKRLQLTLLRCPSYKTRVVLKVPKLECLIVGEYHFPSFVMEDVSSLVEVSISPYVHASNHEWAELLKGVSGVKSLSLGDIPHGLFLPIFPNLKRLELKSKRKRHSRYGKIKIFQFLESCPELKHLYMEEDVGSGLRNPKSVPTCLLTNLTTIKFLNRKGSKYEMQFLVYVLGNAKALKMVTITCDKSIINGNEEARLRAQLLKRKRASTCCEIQFPGNLSHSSIS